MCVHLCVCICLWCVQYRSMHVSFPFNLYLSQLTSGRVCETAVPAVVPNGIYSLYTHTHTHTLPNVSPHPLSFHPIPPHATSSLTLQPSEWKKAFVSKHVVCRIKAAACVYTVYPLLCFCHRYGHLCAAASLPLRMFKGHTHWEQAHACEHL